MSLDYRCARCGKPIGPAMHSLVGWCLECCEIPENVCAWCGEGINEELMRSPEQLNLGVCSERCAKHLRDDNR